MTNSIRVKRRLLGTAGAPLILKSSELAFNHLDGNFYIGVGSDGNGDALTIEPIGGIGLGKTTFFNSRADAVAATVHILVQRITVNDNGMILDYLRDATGTALQTNAGAANWSPPLNKITPFHWGARRDVTYDSHAEIQAMFDWGAIKQVEQLWDGSANREYPDGGGLTYDFSGGILASGSQIDINADNSHCTVFQPKMVAIAGTWATNGTEVIPNVITITKDDYMFRCKSNANYVRFVEPDLNLNGFCGGIKIRSRNWVMRPNIRRIGYVHGQAMGSVGIYCASGDTHVRDGWVGQWDLNDAEYFDRDAYGGVGIYCADSDATVIGTKFRWSGANIVIAGTNNRFVQIHSFNGMKQYSWNERSGATELKTALDAYFGFDTGSHNFPVRQSHPGIVILKEHDGNQGKNWDNTFDDCYFDNCHFELYSDGVRFNNPKLGSKPTSSLTAPGATYVDGSSVTGSPNIDYWWKCYAHETNGVPRLAISGLEPYVEGTVKKMVVLEDVTGSNWVNDGSSFEGLDINQMEETFGDFFQMHRPYTSVNPDPDDYHVLWYAWGAQSFIAFADDGTTRTGDAITGKIEVGSYGDHLRLYSSHGSIFTGNTVPGALGADNSITVSTGNSGVTGIHSFADQIIAENNGHAGITIATPNDSTGRVVFADPEGSQMGGMRYDHVTDMLSFAANNNYTVHLNSAGDFVVDNHLHTNSISIGGAATGGGPLLQIAGGGNRVYLAPTNLAGSYSWSKEIYYDADVAAQWSIEGGLRAVGSSKIDGVLDIIEGVTGGGYGLRIGNSGDRIYLAVSNLLGSFNWSSEFTLDPNGANKWTAEGGFITTGDLYASGSMRIAQDVTDAPGDGNTTVGVGASTLGKLSCSRSGGAALSVNRSTGDGKLVKFMQDGTEEGDISVSGTTVSLTGAHLSRVSQGLNAETLRGTVLSNLDEMCAWRFAQFTKAVCVQKAQPARPAVEEVYPVREVRDPETGEIIQEAVEAVLAQDAVPAIEAIYEDLVQKVEYLGDEPDGATVEVEFDGEIFEAIVGTEDNEQLNKMAVSSVAGDRDVAGVFEGYDAEDEYGDFKCAQSGDYVIRIAADCVVQRGDLLISAGDGTACPQDDDLIRSSTVAKVTSTQKAKTYDDGSYLVPCVLMVC